MSFQTRELDLKDRKILSALDMNARQPDSTIARHVGLSKQTTHYRIKRLEKNEIIKSYYAVIDHTKLGLKLYRIGIKFENASKEKEREIIKYLEKKASWMVSVLGKWDLWMAFYARDEYGVMDFWRTFYDKYGSHVNSREISLMTRFWNFERSFSNNKNARRNVLTIGEKPSKIQIDEIDEKILHELTVNARKTSFEIAKKIKKTERIVRYRIKKLEKQNIILGYRTFLNTKLLGLRYYKIFIMLQNAQKKDLSTIREFITQEPNVIYSTEAVGKYDFEIEIQCTGSEDLFVFMTTLRERFPDKIKSIEHLEYMKEHKVTYYPTL